MKEPAGLRAGAQTLTAWCVTAPSSATASSPWMISSTVVVFIPLRHPGYLFERLELDEGSAVVAAGPEGDRRGRVVDEHSANVGGPRQQVFHELPVLRVEPRDAVVQHRAGPRLAVLVERHVVRARPRRRHRPLLEALGFRVEHRDAVAAVLAEPDAVLRVHD